MSRTTNEKLVSPCSKFISWKNGTFSYWDKATESNIEIKIPVRFLVLDTLNTIKGYSDTDQSGFWSNEVRDTKKEIITVYTKVGVKAKGLYEQVKANPACTGAKYCQSVYIALVEGDKLSLANIQMTGAAVSAWIDFTKDNDLYKGAIEVNSSIEGKKGATKYQIPVFTKVDVTDKINKEAENLDKTLQEYLALYFKKSESVEISETSTN